MPIIRTKLNAGEWRRVAGWVVKVVMAPLAAAQAVFEQGIVNLTQKWPQNCWKFLALLLMFQFTGVLYLDFISYPYSLWMDF